MSPESDPEPAPLSSRSLPNHNLTQFHPFPRLPIELRFKIFREALRVAPARVVAVAHEYAPPFRMTYGKDGTYRVRANGDDIRILRTVTPAPPLLSVCQESRIEALKKYSLRLDTEMQACYIRIDPDNEAIYFAKSGLESEELKPEDQLSRAARDGLRFLAIDSMHEHVLMQLPKFKNVDSLTIVLHYEGCNAHWSDAGDVKYTSLEHSTEMDQAWWDMYEYFYEGLQIYWREEVGCDIPFETEFMQIARDRVRCCRE